MRLLSEQMFEHCMQVITDKHVNVLASPSLQHCPFIGEIPNPTRGLLGAVIRCAQQCNETIGIIFSYIHKDGTIKTRNISIPLIPDISFENAKTIGELNERYQKAINDAIVRLYKKACMKSMPILKLKNPEN